MECQVCLIMNMPVLHAMNQRQKRDQVGEKREREGEEVRKEGGGGLKDRQEGGEMLSYFF